jgi:hypothetical protein
MPNQAGPSLKALSVALARTSQAQADRSLARLHSTTGVSPDPGKPRDVIALRVWLNAWTCRIPYPQNGVDLFAPSIRGWWTTHGRTLPDIPLVEADDRTLDQFADAYIELLTLPAGINKLGRIRSLAPTASSKLLWVLRSQTACPWDVAIAKAGGSGTHRLGYLNHLRTAREWTQRITAEAIAQGINDVPTHVGRPQSSLVKVYDEWCYLTMTRPRS